MVSNEEVREYMSFSVVARAASLMAIVGVVLAIGVASAGAAALSFSKAREVSIRIIDREHCPDPCSSTRVHDCDRIGGRKIVCGGRTTTLAGGGSRTCRGAVRVSKRPEGGVETKSISWSCSAN